MTCIRLQIQLQYVKMVSSGRNAFHPVDILTMEKSVSTSVPVILMNVITSRDVETGQVYIF